MSPRLVIILAVMGIVASGVGVARWIVLPHPASVSGTGEASSATSSDAARREYREKFFGGDTDRDIRGGQEMKPRW
ncbi:entry exclusion protein TrbK [Agrobacterium vitis]|uniref:Entry exclusion protein TrbK n=1 Tax=Agrobacterium vitis TaxID=373 RepID=A0ABD6G9N9_AGRVI|nr:entry exclusion protein TrbK [Agrobacterium vitis]MUO94686.1 entry exclusion protein TrbK [Agrobacterium vitis]MUP05552.1 entry exclusion protein TrbK [Agrobacterium vitis]MUZ81454.1 entry exclusion protein TrbK [Agrobacterium vitis]MVA92616.1 entry exclusion protein TrbK [Agrobacterium vitis]